jgi:ATP-dependent protease HslVU (ClpYQ) peptidase subunit
MTVIVGLETDKGVIIGADSIAISGYNALATTIEKVFIKDGFIFGVCGNFRIAQLIRYKASFPEKVGDQPDFQYLSTVIIDCIKKVLKDDNFEDEENQEPTLLVGYNGKLYVIYHDFQVNRFLGGYFALGYGSDFALGSLFSTSKLPPMERIKQALNAANHFSAAVLNPYKILMEEPWNPM